MQSRKLTFCDGFVKIFVPRSKTDLYCEGNYVYIAKLESKYFPVTISYVSILKEPIWICLVTLPLLRPLTRNKSGYSFRNANLSYTRFREIFKTTLKA